MKKTHFWNFIQNQGIKHGIFFAFALLLLLLLAKNPFSSRTLIPNFEPFPDTFHYITSARCLLKGEGFRICRNGEGVRPAVPPLYSISLLPFLAVFDDARMFYVGNVFFSII